MNETSHPRWNLMMPLIDKGLLLQGINHFRVGATLFLGADVCNSKLFEALHNDVFTLDAEIIELNEKPLVPNGVLRRNLTGHITSFDKSLEGNCSCRAIVDVYLLDVEEGHIQPINRDIRLAGVSSI